MPELLVCEMPDCDGVLDGETVILQTGCFSSSPFRSCSKCGRVHSYEGFLTFNRPGAAVYVREGVVELVMEPIAFETDKIYLTIGYLLVCLEGKEEDGVPELVDLEPDMLIVYDGMDADHMFRFHDEKGIRYLLNRGNVNGVKERK